MSAQFGNGPKSYPVSVASQDLPQAWLSSSDPRVAGATKKIVSISSQNGTQTSGGQLSFVLPSSMGSGFLASGSAYLKFTVDVTQATARSFIFSGYGSASNVVNRMTLLCSGSISEQILQYNKTYNSLLLHGSSPQFASNDDAVYQQSFGAVANTAAVTVCIPVMLGTFNSKQHLPLFLLNSCQLNVDLDSLANAITTIGANAITEYSVSNATLCFEQINPDHSFEAGIKSMLSTRLFQMGLTTYYNGRVAQATAISQNVGLNASSVRAVLWNNSPAELVTTAGHFTSAGQTSCRVYADGQLVANVNLDNEPQQFIEMNRALSVMFDASIVSIGADADEAPPATVNASTIQTNTRARYTAGSYLGGLSLSKSADAGFSFKGIPVNSLNIEFAGTGTTGTFNYYVILDQILTIDQMGTASLIR